MTPALAAVVKNTSSATASWPDGWLGRVINQFRWCDGVATAQANHTMDATR